MTVGLTAEADRRPEDRAEREHRRLMGLVALLTLVPLGLLLFALFENREAARQFDAVDQSASLSDGSLWIYGVTRNAALAQTLSNVRDAVNAQAAAAALAAPVPPSPPAPGGQTPTSPATPPTPTPSTSAAQILGSLPLDDTSGEDWQSMFRSMERVRNRLRPNYPRQVRATDAAWSAFADSLRTSNYVDWRTATGLRLASDRLTDAIKGQAVRQRQAAYTFLALGIAVLIGSLFLIFPALHRLRQVEETLAEERRGRDALLESTGEGICAVNARGLCTYVNLAGAQMLGYRSAEMTGKNLHALIHHSRADGTPLPPDQDPLLHAPSPDEGARRGEDVLWRRDGTPLPVAYVVSPMRAGRDGVVLTFADIAERKELETLREDLNGMIVHDLRTPLTSLLTGLKTLKIAGDLTSDQQEFLQIAIQGGQTLLGMINDLLDVSKMEAGSLKIQPTEIVPADVIADALAQVAPLAGQTGLKIARHVTPDLPTLQADPDLVRRALINLLGNAVKFTPRGGIVTVAAFPDEEAEGVVFAVGDTGEGIPASALDRIFEKFGQVETRRAGHKMSTGLGLTFCKLVAESHGGRIWVESKLGKGSRFLFAIPRLPAPPTVPLSLAAAPASLV